MNPTPILGIIAGALGQSAAETPVPFGPKIRQRKPWQRASDDRRKLSPRQYVKLRKALARAAREQARARQAAALGPETVADGED